MIALGRRMRSEEHTSELQLLRHLVCRLLLEKKKGYPTRTGCNNDAQAAIDASAPPGRWFLADRRVVMRSGDLPHPDASFCLGENSTPEIYPPARHDALPS